MVIENRAGGNNNSGALSLLLELLRGGAFGGRFNCSLHGAEHSPDCQQCRTRIAQALADPDAREACRVISHSCSWCHELNDVREEFCSHCGHCAHVPRAQCYCPECQRRMGVER